MNVQIAKGIIKTLLRYPVPIREQIFSHIRRLEDPYRAPGVECLFPARQIYRVHIGRSHTAIFKILKESDTVLVLDLMTIEQAHKRYRRYR